MEKATANPAFRISHGFKELMKIISFKSRNHSKPPKLPLHESRN